MEMIPQKDLLVQRYAGHNWPALRGKEPWIVTGPRFSAYVIPGSLEKFGEYRFRPNLERELRQELDDLPIDLGSEIAAELLLREGICDAIWSINVEGVVDESQRWEISLGRMAREIPQARPLSRWIIELLSGMCDVSHYRNLLDSALIIEPVKVPAEVL